MPNTTFHAPTGLKCKVLKMENGRAFCDFGARSNPFTWVSTRDLRSICGLCGSPKPVDRSCDCFDNHCQ